MGADERRRGGGCGWRGRRRGRRRAGRRDRPTSRSGRATDRRDPVRMRSSSHRSSSTRPSAHAGDALVARSIAVGRRHRLRSIGRFRITADAGLAVGSGWCRVGPAIVRLDQVPRPVSPRARRRARRGACPSGDGGRRDGFRHDPPHPHHQQGEGVLARQLAARARAPPRDVDVIDGRLVRLGARPAAPPPHRSLVAPQIEPSLRHRDRLGGAQRRRRRRHRRHLLDRPTPIHSHPDRRYARGVPPPPPPPPAAPPPSGPPPPSTQIVLLALPRQRCRVKSNCCICVDGEGPTGPPPAAQRAASTATHTRARARAVDRHAKHELVPRPSTQVVLLALSRQWCRVKSNCWICVDGEGRNGRPEGAPARSVRRGGGFCAGSWTARPASPCPFAYRTGWGTGVGAGGRSVRVRGRSVADLGSGA